MNKANNMNGRYMPSTLMNTKSYSWIILLSSINEIYAMNCPHLACHVSLCHKWSMAEKNGRVWYQYAMSVSNAMSISECDRQYLFM